MSYAGASEGWNILDPIQEKYNVLLEDLKKGLNSLQLQYHKRCEELYRERSEIVKGSKNGGNGIPHFWLGSLQANDILQEEISERDVDALIYLYNIKCTQKDDGFKLSFFFKQNPYFTNDALTIEFDTTTTGTEIVTRIQASVINWHMDRNLTRISLPPIEIPKYSFPVEKYIIIDELNMVAKEVSSGRNHVEIEYYESFFNLFNYLSAPEGKSDGTSFVHDEEGMEKFKSRLSRKHWIGKIIRDKIIPQAWTAITNGEVGVSKCVEDLRVLQRSHIHLVESFFKDKDKIENAHHTECEQLQTKRNELVDHLAEKVDYFSKFWLKALLGNRFIAQQITHRDKGALGYLLDIRSSKIVNSKGFKLDFYFGTNGYFSNNVLTNSYYMTDDAEPTLKNVVGTEINWYPGKSLTSKVLRNTKKVTGDRSKDTKIMECQSFFNIFAPVRLWKEKDFDQLEMEHAYDIASAIHDIIPVLFGFFYSFMHG